MVSHARYTRSQARLVATTCPSFLLQRRPRANKRPGVLILGATLTLATAIFPTKRRAITSLQSLSTAMPPAKPRTGTLRPRVQPTLWAMLTAQEPAEETVAMLTLSR